MREGPDAVFTCESVQPVILLVSVKEHLVGDVALTRKTQKYLTCYTTTRAPN